MSTQWDDLAQYIRDLEARASEVCEHVLDLEAYDMTEVTMAAEALREALNRGTVLRNRIRGRARQHRLNPPTVLGDPCRVTQEERAAQKQASRDADRRAVESGAKTAEQVNRDNGLGALFRSGGFRIIER